MREDGQAVLDGGNKDDVLSRRRYLIEKLYGVEAAITKMPSHLSSQFQGEWALVTYSMLTAGLTNIAFIYPETRQESLLVVKALIKNALTLESRQFDSARWGEDPIESLDGHNGHIGYLGHLNFMIGAYRFLGGDQEFNQLHHEISAALQRRLVASPGFCLETYPNELIYLPDNVVVIASLANFSRLSGGVYRESVTAWIKIAKNNLLDPELHLLPFQLDSYCNPVGGVRGSGAGWNAFYLPFIDKSFATEQFEMVKKHLVQTWLITGVREYPRGVFGLGDVDSGPVIFGLSPSGTGFAIAGAVHTRDADLLGKFLFTGELVGSSVQWSNDRFYLFAPLVGDSIILAMKTARLWDERYLQSR